VGVWWELPPDKFVVELPVMIFIEVVLFKLLCCKCITVGDGSKQLAAIVAEVFLVWI
jgi:hypothetical protein